MQVKTRIENPTDSVQSYGWVPKYGIMIGAKDSVVIDGDLYTLVMTTQPRNKVAMETDEKEGRVKITLLTDGTIEKLGALADKVLPKAPPPPPIPRGPVDEQNIFSVAPAGKDENILGDGLVEGDIDSAKGPAYDPMSGGVSEMQMPETVNMSEALWKNGTLIENAVPKTEDAQIPVLQEEDKRVVYTKKQLMSMKLERLKKIANALGMPTLDEELTKADIIKWILETQGNADI